MPFGQVAIELEIERLSVVPVPKLLSQVEAGPREGGHRIAQLSELPRRTRYRAYSSPHAYHGNIATRAAQKQPVTWRVSAPRRCSSTWPFFEECLLAELVDDELHRKAIVASFLDERSVRRCRPSRHLRQGGRHHFPTGASDEIVGHHGGWDTQRRGQCPSGTIVRRVGRDVARRRRRPRGRVDG
jgi:hypothetical protein